MFCLIVLTNCLGAAPVSLGAAPVSLGAGQPTERGRRSSIYPGKVQRERSRRGEPASAQQQLSVPARLLAGGTARACSQLVMYPADALRTLAQTRGGAKSLSDLGARTLVSGAATTSAFAYFIGALQFAAYGAAAPRIGPLGAAACGALASCLVSVPQEVIKQRLVTGVYPSTGVAVTSIYRTQGWRGFYTAWGPTVLRNVPFVVITFTTFAMLEKQALQGRGEDKLRFADSLGIGVASALAGCLLTQPVDVVKTRLMTQAASTATPYNGVGDCVRTMLHLEGAGAFYAGLKQRAAYSGPLWALQFGLNTGLSNALMKRRREVAVGVGGV